MTRDIRDVGMIFAVGSPSLIRQGLSSISTLLLNRQAGMYGDAAIAAMSIVGRIAFSFCGGARYRAGLSACLCI